MDVLRENIGLLQLPYEDEYYYDEEDINEGFLGFGKKKSRWQRFKDAINRNPKRTALAIGLLGGTLGGFTGISRSNYNKMKKNFHRGMTNRQDTIIGKAYNLRRDPNDSNSYIADNGEKITLKGWRPWKIYSNSSIRSDPDKYLEVSSHGTKAKIKDILRSK